ncbi:MAG: FAD-binding oxidoreductase [Leptolyngbyaceae cyanobacterium bins.349]|nr:FAD-binding oxidoreductase [Leptolyngbyaceae cyanobacterium bins.349]
MSLTAQILAQLPGNSLAGLRRADELWQSVRENTLPVPAVVTEKQTPLDGVTWDVVICGGTLGILVGAVLAQWGWRVALIERGELRGRAQEWNISRRELQTFVNLGVLTEAELQQAIATEYNPARISFAGGTDVWVRDVLNIGVDPVFLLATLKQKFLAAGGQLVEQAPFESVTVHPNGVQVQAGDRPFQARFAIDAMGHFSAIARQARQGRKPDAVCLVVGSCATGFPANETGDLIASFTPIQNQCQYFWEAFPARDGRTTYLFTYLDADPTRISLETLFDEYLRLLPTYQQVALEQLQFKRALFGCFPCYRQSPLRLPWNRILAVGDSSGSQSPLSFGGFGAMVRHLQRLSTGIQEALQADVLDRRALAALQPYQPNLSVTWLFQQAMSVGVNQKVAPNQINEMLAGIFQDMAQLGDPVLKPFLQDVVQFPALFQTLTQTAMRHPQLVLKVIPQVGISSLGEWLGHYARLASYAALYPLAQPFRARVASYPPGIQYYFRRWLDALEYGSGQDYGHEG